MILLLDTSTPQCRLAIIDGGERFEHSWQADRQLAKNLLRYLRDQLETHGYGWGDIKAIGVFEGPGSFTGLRIGLTVLNTIAQANNIPIVGAQGVTWQEAVLKRIKYGDNDHIVIPFYGSDPHITSARK